MNNMKDTKSIQSEVALGENSLVSTAIIKKINKILTLLSFIVPCIIYLLTMAPTVSLWDCGEFIATSVTMGVPHPPGTPLYLIISNFFSQIPLFSDMGARVNLVSPIASALSVMFLYMIIVYLIEEFSNDDGISKYYAAFIGAITFSITDSQWFNAVESEVYALSTFFTAIVVWLILKWAKNIDNQYSIKYLILISYCLGLAIGIHLLNLLAIPFIGIIIFFKYTSKYQKISIYNILGFSIGTGLAFIIIYLGIIKGLPSIANKTNSMLVIIIFITITIVAMLISNIKSKIINQISIYIFSLIILFLTLNQIFIKDYKEMQLSHKRALGEYSNSVIKEQNQLYQKYLKAPSEEAQLFHYMDLIKSNIKLEISDAFVKQADIKIKEYDEGNGIWEEDEEFMDLNLNGTRDKFETFIENKGMNYFSLIKKQYFLPVFLSISLIILMTFGVFYGTQTISNHMGIYRIILSSTLMIIIGYSTYSLIFIRAQQNPKINYNNPHDVESVYQYINRDQYGQWDITDREKSLLVNSQQNSESWRRYLPTEFNEKGELIYPTEASSSRVRNFVWEYQFKEMYLRYFAWQFIGKESWEDRSWTRNSLEGQELMSLPNLQGVDWTRYGLPIAFLIGLIGAFYHFIKDWRRWISVNALFILTGIAIVVYLNQSDPQPRERDYAYVGSFFAFSVWIGIGCYALIDEFKKNIVKNTLIPSAILFIIMPLLMGIIDYNEHDRSKRFEAWDYAYNLLNSCEPNAILFTNGDNDTFPLWYMQEVEKIRTDVKVVNLSLLNFPSYIHQLDQHEPSLNIFDENDEYLKIVQEENYQKLMDYAIGRWIVDGNYNIHINAFNNQNILGQSSTFKWKFKHGTYSLGLTNFTIMKIIETCFHKQPIYFSTTTGSNNLGLNDYLVQEGLVYRLIDKKHNDTDDSDLVKTFKKIGLIRPEDEIKMNVEKTISMIQKATGEPFIDSNENMNYEDGEEFTDLNKNGVWDKELIIKTKEDYIEYQTWLEEYPNIGTYRYTNLDQKGIYYGPHIERLAANYRNVFFKAAEKIALNDGLVSEYYIVQKFDGNSANIYQELPQIEGVQTPNYNETNNNKDNYSINKNMPDNKNLDNSFKILNLLHEYYPSDVIPTETSYDYGALGYCQLLLQIEMYKQINENSYSIENEEKVTNQVASLLKGVNSKLVEKYFPDFYKIITTID